MNGLKIKRKADRALFTISGEYEGGVVLTPDEFGPPIHETLAGLHDGYTVASKGDALPTGPPLSADMEKGWQALADASWDATQAVEHVNGNEGETVEQFFARVSEDES